MESTELARLRRVTEKQATRLTHCGRKTGRPYDFTIWFVLNGDKLFVGTANVNRQWVQNVQKTPQVKLSIGGEEIRSHSCRYGRLTRSLRQRQKTSKPS